MVAANDQGLGGLTDADLSPEAVELRKQLGLDQGYTPEAVSEALEVNVSTVYRWLQSGKLGGKQYGKQWRINARDVTDFVEDQQRERQRLINAKDALRLAKRVHSDRNWEIQACAICGGPVVTDGQYNQRADRVLFHGPEGRKYFACPWPLSCSSELSEVLNAGENPDPPSEAMIDFDSEDIPFE